MSTMQVLNKQQIRAIAAVAASQQKLTDLQKMVAKAEREFGRKLSHASEVGVSDAELGRTIGVSKGRVWQLLRDLGVKGGYKAS